MCRVRPIYWYQPIIGLANHRICNIGLVLDRRLLGPIWEWVDRYEYTKSPNLGKLIQKSGLKINKILIPQKYLNPLTTLNLDLNVSNICDSKLKILFSKNWYHICISRYEKKNIGNSSNWPI